MSSTSMPLLESPSEITSMCPKCTIQVQTYLEELKTLRGAQLECASMAKDIQNAYKCIESQRREMISYREGRKTIFNPDSSIYELMQGVGQKVQDEANRKEHALRVLFQQQMTIMSYREQQLVSTLQQTIQEIGRLNIEKNWLISRSSPTQSVQAPPIEVTETQSIASSNDPDPNATSRSSVESSKTTTTWASVTSTISNKSSSSLEEWPALSSTTLASDSEIPCITKIKKNNGNKAKIFSTTLRVLERTENNQPDEMNELKIQRDILNSDLERKQTEINDLKNALENKQSELNELQSIYDATVAAQMKSTQDSLNQLSKERKENEELQKCMNELKNINKTVSQNRDVIQAQLYAASQRIHELETQTVQYQNEINAEVNNRSEYASFVLTINAALNDTLIATALRDSGAYTNSESSDCNNNNNEKKPKGSKGKCKRSV